MFSRIVVVLAFSLIIRAGWSQQNAALYTMLRNSYNGHETLKTVSYVEQRWRLPGNTGFNESIYFVEDILRKAGFEKRDDESGPLTYRIEKRPMQKLTWEPVDASITIEGSNQPLLQFKSNRNMIAIHSKSTIDTGITAEVVFVGKEDKDWEAVDVKDKIVFCEAYSALAYKKAMAKGAAGVLVYSIPGFNQPQKHQNSISFQGIELKDSVNQKWCILLSTEAKNKLTEALTKGSVKANVKVKTKMYQADELTLVATAKGNSLPNERFVFSAHVQEPGANDNASGVGTLAEMARVTATLIKSGKFTPARSIVFLWGDEIKSTARYILEDQERAEGIKWGVSLDMVGEDVAKTGGTFLIEKMPDPSAVWPRGEEKHTEWGGMILPEDRIVPNYFNDYLLSRCLEQASYNNWVVKTNPYEGGSDHTPFLEAKIPGLLLWHFTDVYYHTDGDRLMNVSADEMKNVGVSALAASYILTSADEPMTLQLIEEAKQNALSRMDTEGQLTLNAIKAGSDAGKELHILRMWERFYHQSFDLMKEIPVNAKPKKIQKAIDGARKAVTAKTESWINKFTNPPDKKK